MKSYIISSILFLFGNISLCQQFYYPVCNKSSAVADELIPENWNFKNSATGDLNGDNVPDLAMIIEYKDTIQEVRPDSSVNEGSPRILLLYFKNPKSGNYELALQNNTFIVRYNEGGMDPEPHCDLSITHKVLDVSFDFLRSPVEYKFRYQQNDFYLIGFNSVGVTGEDMEIWDMNFSTKKIKFEKGKISSDKRKYKWYNMPPDTKIKLKDLKMVFRLQIIPETSI